MKIKAEGTFNTHIIISSKGTALGKVGASVGHVIFYGKSINAVLSWLRGQTGKTMLLEDEVVRTFHGTYTKQAYGKTETHDPMSFRHAGFGQAAISAAADQGLAEFAVGGTMKLTGITQERGFVAFVGDRAGVPNYLPKIMQHQTSIELFGTQARGDIDRVPIDVSTGYITLTDQRARTIAADQNSTPAQKWHAKFYLYQKYGTFD
jgi:hypothetical protein